MFEQMTYTDIADFQKVCDIPLEGGDFAQLEDLAIITIEEYSVQFPNLDEWEDLKTADKFTYQNIYKGIVYEMKFIAENPENFTDVQGVGGNYSVGRISVNEGTKISGAERELLKLSPMAKMYIDRSGIVMKDLCTTNYNKCNPCDCVQEIL